MIHQNEWIYFKKIDWKDSKFNKFSIDTRDFHCGYTNDLHPDYHTLVKFKERFFHTEEELLNTLNRLHSESGGDCEWRYLSLETGCNWGLKYLRIYRTDEDLFIICDSYSKALSKEFLSLPVDQELLNDH